MPTHRLRQHQNNFNHHADPQIPSPSPSPPPPKPNQQLLSLFLKSIIMGLILSLFLLFLGVAAIAFLHILLLGSFLHRRRRLSNPTSPTSSSGAFSFDQLQKYLPSFKYSPRSSVTAKECSICLEYFKEGDFCRTLPACSHVFHASCVDQWLSKVSNCPVCRTQVQLQTGTSDSLINDEDFKLLWTIGV